MVKLNLLESRPVLTAPKVGDMWLERSYVEGPHAPAYAGRLSREYRATGAGKRAPYVVRFPDGSDTVLDFIAGLRVSGDAPALTVEGPISVRGRTWYIRDGQILTQHEVDQPAQKAPEADTRAMTDEEATNPGRRTDVQHKG